MFPDYAPQPGHVFCATEEIEEGKGKDFVFRSEDKKLFLVFIVRKNDELYAYLNLCPHWGLPLNWRPGKFFTPDGLYLFCANHGAGLPGRGRLLRQRPVPGRELAQARHRARRRPNHHGRMAGSVGTTDRRPADTLDSSAVKCACAASLPGLAGA